MSNTRLRGATLAAIAGAVLLLTPLASQAQRRGGWSWGGQGYDPWGYYNRGTSGFTGGTVTQPSYQANFPAERLTPADGKAAGFVVRLPDPNAQVWFDNYATKQQGNVRGYVSDNLEPNRTYSYHVRARWMDNGRPVEQTRDVTVRAGQQVSVDFTTPAGK
jgi:uncharacterized protein (TIGR03000 family)